MPNPDYQLYQNGNKCVGVVNAGIGIYSPIYNTIINDTANRQPLQIPENGQLLYIYRNSAYRYVLTKWLSYYYFLFFTLTLISIFINSNINFILWMIAICVPLCLYAIYFSSSHRLRLFNDRIELLSNGSNIIYFHSIRKIKQEKLNLKIYLKHTLYPKYIIAFRNIDQLETLTEVFEHWLIDQGEHNPMYNERNASSIATASG